MSKATAAATQDSSLNITGIAVFPVCEPVSKTRYSLLRLKTQSGLVGWGECRYDPNADGKTLQSDWIGKPANAYSTIPPSNPFCAALDMACLDILGHKSNAPVYRILGGPTRSKIRAYTWRPIRKIPLCLSSKPRGPLGATRDKPTRTGSQRQSMPSHGTKTSS
jgi:L-alanine-DL-glutamate epimerase-like enolase superfamily enzyme